MERQTYFLIQYKPKELNRVLNNERCVKKEKKGLAMPIHKVRRNGM